MYRDISTHAVQEFAEKETISLGSMILLQLWAAVYSVVTSVISFQHHRWIVGILFIGILTLCVWLIYTTGTRIINIRKEAKKLDTAPPITPEDPALPLWVWNPLLRKTSLMVSIHVVEKCMSVIWGALFAAMAVLVGGPIIDFLIWLTFATVNGWCLIGYLRLRSKLKAVDNQEPPSSGSALPPGTSAA